MVKANGERNRLDDAARAGWLYYVAGNTQDEIARKLGVSRQSAQRLVSLAVTEKLIKVRVEHPIAHCMELASELTARYGLNTCEVVPTDPDAPTLLGGIAIAGASEMERHLKSNEPKILALGTGRALRACVEDLPVMDCPHHRIVSLVGNMMSDGSATPYNVVIRMAERIGCRHNPMPLPVFVRSPEELEILHSQEPVANTLALCRQADATFVGIGHLDSTSPIVVDGFITQDEIRALEKAGAVGEITSWTYDLDGNILSGLINARATSAPLKVNSARPVVGVAIGAAKTVAIQAAMRGKLINGLITDEATAEAVLARD
jgi:DNA-binding transcriptional regulator LsrR (DeoR family)